MLKTDRDGVVCERGLHVGGRNLGIALWEAWEERVINRIPKVVGTRSKILLCHVIVCSRNQTKKKWEQYVNGTGSMKFRPPPPKLDQIN